MSLRTEAVPYGRPAAERLLAAVHDVQQGDPLRPVTVVVTRGAVGLSLRRLLASARIERPPGMGPGLGNVRFLTTPGLTALLEDGALGAAGRLPLTAAVLAAACRLVLRQATTSVLGPVAEHPATVRAVATAYRDLRSAGEATLDRLAQQSPRAAAVVAVTREVRERLAGFYDDADVADAACRRVTAGPDAAAALLGAVIVHLPADQPPWSERLLEVLAGALPVRLLIGLTGEDEADGPARALAERFGSPLPPGAPGVDGAGSRRVVNAPTADAEVLAAVRTVAGHLVDGVPPERIAVVDGGAGPYRRMVTEALDAAGIPYHGGSLRPLSATVAGRALLGLLELPERGWRRDDVIAWLSGAPIRDGAGEVPATVWDAISSEAGVVAGLDQWQTRLAAHVRALEVSADAAAGGDEPEWRIDQARRQHRFARRLAEFVDGLAARLADVPDSWDGWAAWSGRALGAYLGGPPVRSSWPLAEELALAEVEAALSSLGALDRLSAAGGRPDAAAFRAAVVGELERPAPATARTGRGVMVGRVGDLVGMDVSVALVLGMVDGVFPATGQEDPLLPDRERAAAGAEVPLRLGRRAEALRDYLGALAGPDEVVLSFARGDQRHGREQRPSRWLLDAVADLAGDGRRLYAGDLADLAAPPGYQVLVSYTSVVAGPGEPASAADLVLRSLARWHQGHGGVIGHPLARPGGPFHGPLDAGRSRRSRRFTRFDGLVADPSVGSPTDPQSPTGLESYAVCPRRYLLGRVLRVRARERPEEVLRLSPRDRGTLVHAVLERFLAPEVERPVGERIAPDQSWSDADRARLDGLWEEECDAAEARGITGAPLLWRVDRLAIRRDLHRFLAEDARRRREWRSVPDAVELAFGIDRRPGAAPMVTVDLAGGRAVHFRGKIDRVDRTVDGALVVIDYKTGSAYDADRVADEAGHGRKLQLPVYALAAAAAEGGGGGGGSVRSLYWYVSEKGGFTTGEYRLDGAARTQLRQVLTAMTDGIASGVFPARPGAPGRFGFESCRFCDFDPLCPRERGRQWDRKHQDPAMAGYVALAVDGVGRPDGTEAR